MVIFENDGSQNTGMNDSVGLIIGDINNAYIIIADSCVLNNYDTAVKAGLMAVHMERQSLSAVIHTVKFHCCQYRKIQLKHLQMLIYRWLCLVIRIR